MATIDIRRAPAASYAIKTATTNLSLSEGENYQDISGIDLTVILGKYLTIFNSQVTTIPEIVSVKCISELDRIIVDINAKTFSAHDPAYGAGEILSPGNYFNSGATTQSGVLEFDANGDEDATWIIKSGAAHAIAASSTMVLSNGAKASNIFWYVIGALSVGATCVLKGTFISDAAITLGSGGNVVGRLFTTAGAVGMTNTIHVKPSETNTIVDLGFLETFAIFTAIGAISNTIITGNDGDICTGNGTVSGFDDIIGTVYIGNDTGMKASFAIFCNNVIIENSKRSYQPNDFHDDLEIYTQTEAITTSSQIITVKVLITLGSLIIKNRVISAQKK